jgi:N-dimethylarginine dimethylaminohydrolase
MPVFSRPTILMCPPDFYGIEYEINPWMKRDVPSDRALALKQWNGLRSILTELGAEIRLMAPVPGLPDLVFTANAGLVWKDVVFLPNFRFGPRQGETPIDETWFQSQGFATEKLPETFNFEGAGDALFCGDTLYGGYIIRSTANSIQWVGKRMGCRVIPLQLVSEHFYHVDTCFCPIAEDTAIYYPGAFDHYAITALKSVPRLISVVPEEAARFACNAVAIGTHVVMNAGCPQLVEALERAGFTAHATPLDEFLKAGGSAKCLTLRLDGEDAAVWP